MSYYGQFNTDIFIEQYFPSGYIGNCVEVGAGDGINLSNTKHFEELGWKRICIEPNPVHNKDWPYWFQCAAGAENQHDVDFHVFLFCNNTYDGLSGLRVDEKLYASHKHMIAKDYTIKVNVYTLDYILAQSKIPYVDFISIDTEGTELEVLKGLDIRTWYPKLFIIENNHGTHECEDYLYRQGYVLDKKVEINDFFIRRTV